jgi:hypothetical protein
MEPNVTKMTWEEWCAPATEEDLRKSGRWPECNCGAGRCVYGEPLEHPGHSENLRRLWKETAENLWECPECGLKFYNEPYYVEHHKEFEHGNSE